MRLNDSGGGGMVVVEASKVTYNGSSDGSGIMETIMVVMLDWW